MRQPRPANSRRRRRGAWLPLATALAAWLCTSPAGAVDYAWGGGNYSASGLPATVTLNDTLTLGCWPAWCGTRLLDADLLNNGTVVATEALHFYYGNTLTNRWMLELRGDVGLFNQYGNNTLVNDSVLVKTTGSGSAQITVNSQHSLGAVADAMSGTLDFAAGSHRFDNGAILMAAAGASVRFSGGSNTSFADGVRWTGAGLYEMAANASFQGSVAAQQLRFQDASWTGGDGSAGSQAVLRSDAVWASSGRLEGQWRNAAGNTLSLQGNGSKYLGSTAGLTNEGTLDLQDHLHFWNYSSLLNTGRVQLNGDVGLYETYGGSQFVNQGVLAKVAGSGTSAVHLAVSNSGEVRADAGTLAFSFGASSFNDGTRFTGAGEVRVNSAASFGGAIQSANLVLADATWTGYDAVLSGQVRWQGGGRLEGSWRTAAGSTTTLEGAAYKYLGSGASWVNDGEVQAGDHLRLWNYSRLENNGRWVLDGDVGLYETYGGSLVQNNGTLVKAAGSGSSAITVSVAGGASSRVQVQQGVLDFQGGSHSFAAGARFDVAAGSALRFTGGSAAFADGVQWLGAGQVLMAANASFQGGVAAQQLRFQDASWSGGDGSAGSQAVLRSDAVWTGGGRLEGQWRNAAGNTLSLQGSGTKYLGSGASLANEGTLDLQDHLRFWNYSGLTNTGRVQLNGDVGLFETYGGSQFVNQGVLAKVAGSGTSAVHLAVSNSGEVRADTGTLAFSFGASQFNAGTRFTGAGEVRVNSAASFGGAIQSANLVLADATWTGYDAVLSGQVRWQGGGRLEGSWRTAAGSTTTLEGTAYKYLGSGASWVNDGEVQAGDHLRLWNYSSLVNNGRWVLDGDVGLYETYGGSQVLNNGTLVKSAGSGESVIAVAFSNAGAVDVRSGTLRLPDGFTNAGTLTGSGHFAGAALVNEGHIAPGTGVGTLSFDGALTLGAGSMLDVELASASQHDQLLVAGPLTLGGTLSLQCLAGCHLAAGSDLLLIDGQGALTGQFDAIQFGGQALTAASGLTVTVDAAHADVWLHVGHDITSAVPEPQTWALWGAGLGALLMMMGRRRRDAGQRIRG